MEDLSGESLKQNPYANNRLTYKLILSIKMLELPYTGHYIVIIIANMAILILFNIFIADNFAI